MFHMSIFYIKCLHKCEFYLWRHACLPSLRCLCSTDGVRIRPSITFVFCCQTENCVWYQTAHLTHTGKDNINEMNLFNNFCVYLCKDCGVCTCLSYISAVWLSSHIGVCGGEAGIHADDSTAFAGLDGFHTVSLGWTYTHILPIKSLKTLDKYVSYDLKCLKLLA